jgi:nickel-dependent lactate racemase
VLIDNDQRAETCVVELAYGRLRVPVSFPKHNLLGVMRPIEPELPGSAFHEVQRALDDPLGAPCLHQLVKPGMKVVIMASDITRPSPSNILLPPLLERLNEAGVKDEDITVVFGMGIHRNHTLAEKTGLVGKDVFSRVKFIDSTEEAAGGFVRLGITSRGTPVEVCRVVADADFIIATGNVEFHYFAGYSGGAKAVLPGACSRSTLEANHSMQLLEGATSGSYDNNPVRQDIEEAGKLIGLNYILNVVLDDEKRIVKAFAGHPQVAHSFARQMVDNLYGVEIPCLADIVVASAGGFPKDVNLYQAQKGLENAAKAVKDGGTIILLAECSEGIGEDIFERYMTCMELEEIIKSIKQRFVLGGHKAAAIARVLLRKEVWLISAMDRDKIIQCKLTPKVPRAIYLDSQKVGIDEVSSIMKNALIEALEKTGSDASIWVMPHSGSTVPLLDS